MDRIKLGEILALIAIFLGGATIIMGAFTGQYADTNTLGGILVIVIGALVLVMARTRRSSGK